MNRRDLVKRVLFVSSAAAVGVTLIQATSRAGILGGLFGEDDVLLGQILVQATHSAQELRTVTQTVGDVANAAETLLDTYQQVNAGIEVLKHYTTDDFLRDFKGDIYHMYPSLAKLEYASDRLTHWDSTYTTSPWTAYEAISAVADDLTGPLRDDIKAGRVNVDDELILRREAAGGFALATTAEQATQTYDRELAKLRERYAANADPGTAAMIAAHTNLILAEQNSHIIRLLSRTVRLDGVGKAVTASERFRSMNATYERREATENLFNEAVKPPRMMVFDSGDGP